MTRTTTTTLALTACTIAAIASTADAAARTWTRGGADTDWRTAANWMGGNIAKAGDEAIFNNAVGNPINNASFSRNHAIGKMTLNVDATTSVDLNGKNFRASGLGVPARSVELKKGSFLFLRDGFFNFQKTINTDDASIIIGTDARVLAGSFLDLLGGDSSLTLNDNAKLTTQGRTEILGDGAAQIDLKGTSRWRSNGNIVVDGGNNILNPLDFNIGKDAKVTVKPGGATAIFLRGNAVLKNEKNVTGPIISGLKSDVKNGARVAPGGRGGGGGLLGAITTDTTSYFAMNGFFTHEAEGSLDIELAGTAFGESYDALVVRGGVSLEGGALDVSLLGGFDPSPGDKFTVLRATQSISGDFAGLADGSFIQPDNASFPFQVVYHRGSLPGGASSVVLRAVPAPSTAACLGLAMFPALRRRRPTAG
ncbi:MAG: hypothetical protein RLN60_01850 [Phycisphaerales bacterium]